MIPRTLTGCLTAGALLLAGCTPGPAIAQGSPANAPATLRRVLAEEPLTRPVHLAPLPGAGERLVVVEQRGRVLRFRPDAGRAEGVFLDLQDRVSDAGNEEGLLSIAFHPDYARNRTFFVYYSAANPRRSVVARFQADAAGTAARPETGTVVLEVPQPYSNHNGGQLAFGPDGMLYVALGDGGAGGDPLGHGQNPRTLLGSLLRLDVDRPTPGRHYGIPADNPFADGRGGNRPEIWAYGLRNPWRFSFDRATGALFAADVGQNAVEEVNRIERGGNYGWNRMEGSHCYEPPVSCAQPGLIGPLTEYSHAEGQSITGGFVYRGRAIPALAGRYLFADYVSGTVWSVPADAPAPQAPRRLLATGLRISSFGEDAAGELYVLDHGGGRIFRLVPAP